MRAIVIGAGPNGLVAANLLADRGHDVLVLEEQHEIGGAVRSGPLTGDPAYTHDLFSAFYPLAATSPIVQRLRLEEHGLCWQRSALVCAHPLQDGRCVALSTDLDETAASLETFAAGDGDAWREVCAEWARVRPGFLGAFYGPFPPVRAGLRLATTLGAADLMRFARFAVLPARRMAKELFDGEGGALLLAGNALHGGLAPELPAGGAFGWMMSMLGQQVGFPVPRGGAGELTQAMGRRLRACGGQIACGDGVEHIVVRGGRVAGVRTASGEGFDADVVIADVIVTRLYRELLDQSDLPAGLLSDLERFDLDSATVKVDWALNGPIPWAASDARRAGTIHVAPEGMDDLTTTFAELAMGRLPRKPALVLGQYSMTDPARQPAGAETAWAYTHVPHGHRWDKRRTAAFADRTEQQVERLAPGFRDLIRARHVFTPAGMEAANANLLDGSMNQGVAQMHQMAPFRPLPSTPARPETPIGGLYLGSASAHPGGGVHGVCGANAARAALRQRRFVRAAKAVRRPGHATAPA